MKLDRSSLCSCLFLAALPLASCATHVTLPPLPECHPAHAAAPAAERARPSGLLDRAAPVPAAEPEVTEEAEGMEGHEHHGGHHPPPAAEPDVPEEADEMEHHGHHGHHPPAPAPAPEPEVPEERDETEATEGHEHHGEHPPPPPPPAGRGGR